jgi:glucose-6-phosphate 1-dehydrogenase
MSKPVESRFAFVIFGASGDLSRRKLIPALYHLADMKFLPDRYAVVGTARSPMTDDAFRKVVRQTIQEHKTEIKDNTPGEPGRFYDSFYYQPGDTKQASSFSALKTKLDELDSKLELGGNRLFYLAVAPELVPNIVENLHEADLLGADRNSFVRIIFEKPFGRDLQSALDLNAEIKQFLHEDQIFRIDHYLGKETVQNILTFRFGNSIFEPVFNRTHVKHIRITVSESLGMEGRRGAYYDTAGALRDIVQNHALQLLCLTTMEPPATFRAEAIRDEKVKVLRTLAQMSPNQVAKNTVRGQYEGYRSEEGIKPDSVTETFVAVRTTLDNWRWSGVPIVLQTGKRMQERATDIKIQFNQPPLCVFREFADCPPNPNSLVIRIQPDEGISLSFVCKQPGTGYEVQDVNMDFSYGTTFHKRSPEAYERLLLDALRGDPSLFTRSDEVEAAWRFVSSILDGWSRLPTPEFPNYEPGSEGPNEVNRLLSPAQSLRQ